MASVNAKGKGLNLQLRLKHLNNLLYTIRNVNQLIVRERNIKALVTKICRLIFKIQHYYLTWLVLSNKKGKPIHVACCGKKNFCNKLVKTLTNIDLTQLGCYQKALRRSELLLLKKPAVYCEECQLKVCFNKGSLLLLPISYHNNFYGILGIVLDQRFAQDKNEMSLLKEVTSDIAFALYSLELTKAHQKAQALVKRHEAYLTGLVRAAPTGIGMVKNRILVDINERICQMVGYAKTELVGQSARILYPTQEDFEYVGREKYAQIRDRGVGAVETRWQKKDGSIIHVLLSSAALVKDDLSKGVVFTALDISPLKKLQTNLTKATRDWFNTFNALADPICILNDKHRIVRCNKAMLKLFPLPAKELYGKPCWEVVHNLTEPLADCPVLRMQKSLQRESLEIAIDQRWFEISVDPILDDEGHLVASVHVMRDITERRQLAANLLLFKESVENSSDAITFIKLDGKGRHFYQNNSFLRLFGDLHDYPLQSTFLQNVSREEIIAHIKEGHSWVGEVRVQASDGSTRDCLLRAYAVRNPKNQIQAIVLIFTDLTTQKQNEARQLALQAQLNQAQKMEAIGRLAGGIAHDFNNLLTVINGFSEIALQQLKTGEPLYNELSAIYKAGQKAQEITSQLLAFSRRQPTQAGPLNLNTVVRSMTEILSRLIGEDIKFEIRLGEPLPAILADQSQLEQVLTNLVINARDALDAAKSQTEKRIELETGEAWLSEADCQGKLDFAPGHFVYLRIADNGIGIPLEDQKNIFEPFFTTKKEGTGLGLATVYGILKQHKAFLQLDSQGGYGSTFKIFWPIASAFSQDPHSKPELTKLPLYAAGGHERILLVEDEPDVLSFITSLLQRQGYRLVVAHNGKEALKILKEDPEKFDLLITDLIMPELDGKTLASMARVLYPGLKIIFTSGYTADHLSSLKEDGLEDIPLVTKPFAAREFAQKIREILDQRP